VKQHLDCGSSAARCWVCVLSGHRDVHKGLPALAGLTVQSSRMRRMHGRLPVLVGLATQTPIMRPLSKESRSQLCLKVLRPHEVGEISSSAVSLTMGMGKSCRS
uniref:Uncharacterized protein n=1 Tax=Varanus komodoensis TaxID=61221 RepID=A0A8D2LNK5_VARKO